MAAAAWRTGRVRWFSRGKTGPVDFDQVADELYGLAPSGFTATRDARAKEARAAGDRALGARIAALRRPTVSAWLANRLVRERRTQTQALIDLGSDLRDAQAELSGDELRRLSRRKSEVVAGLVRDAEVIARSDGQPVSAAILEELTGTLEATLADPESSDALRSARLTAALHYSGLGFDAATAVETRTGADRGTTSRAAQRGASAPVPVGERRAAEHALERAGRDVARATSSLEEAERVLHDIRQRIRGTEGALKGLRAREAVASAQVSEARRDRAAAQGVERKLQRTAERL
jgi:hypothetical protein